MSFIRDRSKINSGGASASIAASACLDKLNVNSWIGEIILNRHLNYITIVACLRFQAAGRALDGGLKGDSPGAMHKSKFLPFIACARHWLSAGKPRRM